MIVVSEIMTPRHDHEDAGALDEIFPEPDEILSGERPLGATGRRNPSL
jgi:hypothetical protein